MTVLASDLVEETRALLFTGQEDEGNRLDGAVTSNATAITFKYPLGSISRGAVIAVDLEDIRIWDTSGNLSATVVERAVNGTVAAAHSDLAYVQVRPKFSPFRILRAINEDLLDLSSPVNGLFQVLTVDLTFNASISGYDLTNVTNIVNVLELRWKQAGPSKKWPLIRKYALSRVMASSEFASTLALFIDEPAFPGLPIHVRYSSDFGTLTALSDAVGTVTGLPASANDLPPMGAAIRLVAPREIKRNFTEAQYDPKLSEAVPAGAVGQSINNLKVLRQQRIIAEQARLASDWPIYR